MTPQRAESKVWGSPWPTGADCLLGQKCSRFSSPPIGSPHICRSWSRQQDSQGYWTGSRTGRASGSLSQAPPHLLWDLDMWCSLLHWKRGDKTDNWKEEKRKWKWGLAQVEFWCLNSFFPLLSVTFLEVANVFILSLAFQSLLVLSIHIWL